MSSQAWKFSCICAGALLLAGASVSDLAHGLTGGNESPKIPTSLSSPTSSKDELHLRIFQDLSRSIRENLGARSYGEWENSGYTPTDILDHVAALKDPATDRALCDELALLRISDLALFESAIQEKTSLPCAEELETKLEIHWMFARAEAQAAIGSPTAPVARLSSHESHVDATQSPTLTHGGLKPGEITLTFSDGPHVVRTPRILKILREAGVRANFFQAGRNVRAHASLSKQTADEGHIVGSHSYDHLDLARLTVAEAEHQIASGRTQVALATEIHTPFFRFPYGSFTPTLQDSIRKEGLVNFLWNMDSLDWKLRDPKALLKNVLKELDRERGGILQFHDTQEQTVIVLPLLLDELKARGLTTVVFVPH